MTQKLRRDYVTREVWRHNGLQGKIAMARQAMIAVQMTSTTSDAAISLARKIEKDLLELAVLTIPRWDPPSAFKKEELP